MPFSPARVVAALVGLAIVTTSLVVAPARSADAANAADFDPGFLVSDADFFNGTGLTAVQIDSFIAGMNKGCDKGKTCLENYREDVTAKDVTTRCSAIDAAPKQTAGQVIATVAKACGISAKAILVILQKEQSLVTATAPSARSFAFAMGAGCPDSTGCDTPNQGLYAQVYYGASLLKGYTLPSSTNFKRYPVGATSAIRYSPTTSCGTKQVFVKNMATHALYVYTPYTPNAAALKNLTGTGDSCSAYGNRNFWRIYTDWWGPTGSAGALAVDALYAQSGGATGALGARVGTIVTSSLKGAGLYQAYEHGVIAWNLKNGAHAIAGDIATAWAARIADFGWPTQDAVTADAGSYQNFDSALLTQAKGGPVYTVWSGTRSQYIASGGPAGPMGWPAGFQAKDATGLYRQVFTAGTAYRKDSTVGFVAAALVDGFTKRGGVTGSLGWPSQFATVSTVRGGGTWQVFAKGDLYTSKLGTQALYGTTRKAFNALGGVAKAGWPIKGRVDIEGTAWQRQDFEKGTMLTKGSSSAWVATALVPTWAASGFSTGTVGKQTKNPVVTTANGGGAYQGFSKATLVRQDGKKTYRLVGLARTAWTALDREKGALGWPTSQASKDAKLKLTVQKFQKGVLIHDGKKYKAVGAKEWALAKKLGVGTGSLGWPSGGVKVSAGGEYQKFANGAITVRKGHAAIYAPKKIWAAWTAKGGVKVLGLPTAAAKTDKKTGKITQKFQHGTITWTKAKGAVVKVTSK